MWSIQHLCAIVRARIEIVLCNSPHWNPDHCGCYPLTALRTQVAVTITAALPDMIGGMLFLSVLCRAIVGLSIIQYHIWMHARLRWQVSTGNRPRLWCLCGHCGICLLAWCSECCTKSDYQRGYADVSYRIPGIWSRKAFNQLASSPFFNIHYYYY
jgi:hypothetical protein